MTRLMMFITGSALLFGWAAAQAEPASLSQLLEGNRRFAASQPTHPNQGSAHRGDVATGQKPFAIIVGCADSRVPPEVIFDQGLGDLFVVRVAGEVVDDQALGSIEFAVAKLGARLIVVLGHERCGAVDAALTGGTVPGHIGRIVDAIKPAIAQSSAAPGNALDNAVRDQAQAVARQLRISEPVLGPMVRDGTLLVVGAVYDLDTGMVQIVDAAGQKP